MSFSVTVLGSSSAIPTARRFPSSQVLNIQERYFLIDCGEGCQIQLRKYKVKIQRIEKIFISHFHGDHFFGLIGLLTTMQLLGREKDLTIYAFPGLKEAIDVQLKLSKGYLTYNLEYVDIKHEYAQIFADSKIEVYSLPLKHGIQCSGFLFKESQKPRRINGDLVKFHGVPHYFMNNLKNGEDFLKEDGSMIANKKLTFEPHASRSYAYITDTKICPEIVEKITDVDLLYHEATFLSDLKERAKQTNHSTAIDAGEMARASNAKKLMLGHFSARYLTFDDHLAEAQIKFKNTIIAKEGNVVEI